MARNPLAATFVLLALSASLLAPLATAQETKGPQRLAGARPNILFVFSDDHAAHAISAYGSRINRTPNIDRIAQAGLLFENCFCGNAICGPSRATILTGRHTHSNGFMRNGNRFDPGQGTFPRMLQRAGYQTAMLGKWHLESDPVGFDHWMVLPDQGQYYNPDFLTKEGKVRIPGYCTDIITDLALKWLDQRDPDRPFLLMCQHKAPHRPWMPGPEELGLYRDGDVPEPATLFDDNAGRGAAARQQEMEIDRHMYLFYDLMLTPTAAEQEHLQGPDRSWKGQLDRMDPTQRAAWDRAFAAENAAFRQNPPIGPELVRWKYQRYIKDYLRCVAGVDKGVGQVLAWLDAHPAVKQNTVVIYCSDQGFYLGDHGWYDKRWMYDTSMRMPLVVSWPGHVPADVRQKALVQNIDFAPTFLELAGVPLPPDMHGVSLVPLLEGQQKPWRDALYYHYYESHAVHNVAAHYGVRTERYKLMHFYEPEHRYWELYDLQQDPDERHNLAELPAYQETRKALTERLQQLRAQYDDRTGELDPYFDVTAGIAAAVRRDGDWYVQANAMGGYALHRLAEPIAKATAVRATLQPAGPGSKGNGFLLLTSGDPRARLFRVGVDFAAGRLQIVGPPAMKVLATAPVVLPASAAVELLVEVDPAAHTLSVRGLGAELQVGMPAEWATVTYLGLGASDAACLGRFTVGDGR